MGRRSEQRIVIAFPVIVRGTDSRGSPFTVTTETHDVSCTGASLKGLQGVAEPGRKIEIDCQNQKAWYRVQWSNAANRRKEWRAGVRCLEPGKYIWGVPPKEWQPDTFDPAAAGSEISADSTAGPSAVPAPPRERRKFARHACRIEAQVAADGAYGKVLVKGKITDISLSGCYVEMLSPLPDETPIELTFNTGQASLHLSAKVCSSQDGFGMGVAFTGMTPDDFEQLRQFAPPTKDSRQQPKAKASYAAHRIEVLAELQPAPSAYVPPRVAYSRQAPPSAPAEPNFELGALDVPDLAIALEAIVRLLLRKQILTRAEIVEELERLKASQT
jgi:PilZ domain